jgi:hypothetical protein
MMKSVVLVVFIVAIAISAPLAVPLGAQWLSYPTAGVPRTADGKPNLSAPAPRTADGKPDFSGTWEMEHNRPCAPGGCNDTQAPHEFFDIAWSLKGSLPLQPWAADLAKARTASLRLDDPISNCQPVGIMELQTTPLLRKIIQAPGLFLILSEYNASYRQIFTDGRPLPIDPQPAWNGYSTGKWDGDTFVVETTGFRDGIWLDTSGNPLTDAAKVSERFRRVNYGRLEVEVTVNDPKAYTKPWTVKLNQILALDTDLLDYICLENEKDLKHLVAK